jgi:CDP-diacylglycerol pyrophosphatase
MTAWRKSSHSTFNGSCAEVAADAGMVLVRDSKDPGSQALRFPAEAWRAFIGCVRADE